MSRIPIVGAAVFALAPSLLAGCGSSAPATVLPVTPPAAPAEPLTAAAELHGAEGGPLGGTVTFTEAEGRVTVRVEVHDVPGAGEHGLHLHENGDCSAADFSSAGPHFNPAAAQHAGPMDMEHHAGDFGNITIGEDGSGILELTTDLLTVSDGPGSVVGRSVILHAQRDDLTTQPTGASGARIACGVVGR